MTKTFAMLEYLLAGGHFVGDLNRAELLLNRQIKMVLLRHFNNWQETNSKHYEDKFLDYWQPIREYLERNM